MPHSFFQENKPDDGRVNLILVGTSFYSLALRLRTTRNVGEVRICCSGEEALNCYVEFKPDIILIDVVQYGMSAIEIARWIKEQTKDQCIIFTSGVHDLALGSCLQANGDEYVPASFNDDVSVKLIKGYIKNLC